MKVKDCQGSTKIINSDEFPPEFEKHEKPFGLPRHILSLYVFLCAHIAAFYYCYLFFIGQLPRQSFFFAVFYGYTSGLGITVGAHRYWAHKTYKAKMPLQILLMLMQTAAWQHPIFTWCRDHRTHHKYTDTDADPHNAARGFWFSHITWLILPKHPKVEEKLKTVYMSDLASDPLLRFQSKYYFELILLVFFIFPITLCKLIFPEMLLWHIFLMNWFRYCSSLHFTFLVNSVAHKWGNKPYDKYITSTETKLVSLLAVGEGWHNYHHTFPWDYKAAELGYKYNLSTAFIHFFAWIGWAYDLKSVSRKMISDRVNRTGDGSHPLYNTRNSNTVEDINDISSRTCWGWGDDQLMKEDIEITEILFPSRRR